MIDLLRTLFFPGPSERTEVSTELAVAALLVEAARADGDYAPAEREAVAALLAELFDMSAEEARALRAEAEVAQSNAPDIVRFTRVIKMGLTEEQRIAVMEGLWRIVFADHQREPHEDALLLRLAPLLAVSDHDSARARQRAMARTGD